MSDKKVKGLGIFKRLRHCHIIRCSSYQKRINGFVSIYRKRAWGYDLMVSMIILIFHEYALYIPQNNGFKFISSYNSI